VAAFDYARVNVRARKAWFCFGDLVVCLGAGILCKGKYPVTTSVNQFWLKGNVATSAGKIKQGARQTAPAPGWVHHDGVGYVFPGKGAVRLEAGPTEGNWHRIDSRRPNKTETADVFSG